MASFSAPVEVIAAICHEANRAYCAHVMGDETQLPWEEAPLWQRQSSTRGVLAAKEGVTSEQLHDKWCQDKINNGWIYGPLKDADLKTHPCLLDYSSLSDEQKRKDTLFRNIVQAFVRA